MVGRLRRSLRAPHFVPAFSGFAASATDHAVILLPSDAGLMAEIVAFSEDITGP
jgi:hypothetical protein